MTAFAFIAREFVQTLHINTQFLPYYIAQVYGLGYEE